ncbi:MAG: ferredoxin [Rhodospirillales bacterium]|nr:ferredoxin [Rhodospirillales bacterium]
MKRIKIDRTRCGATGNCVYWAPNTFEVDNDGVAVVIKQDGDPDELIQQAVTNCPLLAISVVGDDT